MEYLALGLAVAAGVAGIYAAIMYGSNRLKSKIIAEQKSLLDAKDKLIAEQKGMIDDAIARREKIITDLKDELSKMEDDLAACSTPTAVRTRLSKLFP